MYSVVPQADSPLVAVTLKLGELSTIGGDKKTDWLKRNPLGSCEAKYAAHSEEKYQSKYNHEAREGEQAANQCSEEKAAHCCAPFRKMAHLFASAARRLLDCINKRCVM